MSWRVLEGDCVDAMASLDEASVDAVVCDPPYGLGFMGKAWDSPVGQIRWTEAGGPTGKDNTTHSERGGAMKAGKYDLSLSANHAFQAWCERWSREALRVLKPGGHLLAFGGTRTYHRLACAIEDAGFEIRDCIVWLYGSGFPKSLDVSKAIDKAAGVAREVVGPSRYAGRESEADLGVMNDDAWEGGAPRLDTAPATPEAERWQGWGTALKPAHEPVMVARKPLAGTVAANVLEHGTGALNVDGCRVGFTSEADERESKDKNRHADFGSGARENRVYGADERDRGEYGNYDAPGRWPANVVLDKEAAGMLDEQSGERPSNGGRVSDSGLFGGLRAQPEIDTGYGDQGGASRFFYCAKASRAERNAGLDGFPEGASLKLDPTSAMARDGRRGSGVARNAHPTVKPIELMRWLVRLVTPPGGVVLDPFAGSGTTGIAAVLEGFGFIGVEREIEYVAIARARLRFWDEHGLGALEAMRRAERAERARVEHTEAGQLGMFDGEAA